MYTQCIHNVYTNVAFVYICNKYVYILHKNVHICVEFIAPMCYRVATTRPHPCTYLPHCYSTVNTFTLLLTTRPPVLARLTVLWQKLSSSADIVDSTGQLRVSTVWVQPVLYQWMHAQYCTWQYTDSTVHLSPPVCVCPPVYPQCVQVPAISVYSHSRQYFQLCAFTLFGVPVKCIHTVL